MRWRLGVRGLFAFSFRRTSVDANVDEEFNLHLRECEEYLIEQGMSETAARREARQRFGDAGSYRSTALGAQRLQVGRMVMRSSLRVMSLGVVIGMAAAAPLSNTLRTLLFDTSTTDVASFASVGVMIMLAGIAATYVPSRRVTQVDPATTLRQE